MTGKPAPHVIALATTAQEARQLPADLKAKVAGMPDQMLDDGQEEVFSRAEVERGVTEQTPGAPDAKVVPRQKKQNI